MDACQDLCFLSVREELGRRSYSQKRPRSRAHGSGGRECMWSCARAQGRTTKQVSSVRDDLLKQGTLTVENGELRFTIPGMGVYVLAAVAP